MCSLNLRSFLLILSCVILANIVAITVDLEQFGNRDGLDLHKISSKLYKDPIPLNPQKEAKRAYYLGVIRDLQEVKAQVKILKTEDAKQKQLIKDLQEADSQQRMMLYAIQRALLMHAALYF